VLCPGEPKQPSIARGSAAPPSLLQISARRWVAHNYFVNYLNRTCAPREQRVNGACSSSVRDGYYPWECAAACSAEFVPFQRDCIGNNSGVFEPSPFGYYPGYLGERAQQFAQLCSANASLDSLYPAPTAQLNCSALEGGVLRACALNSISSYAAYQTCSAGCAPAYVDFAARCLAAITPANYYFYAQQQFLQSCRGVQPSRPTTAPVLSGGVSADGRTALLRWNISFGNQTAPLSLAFALNVSVNGAASARIYEGPALFFSVPGLVFGSRYRFVVHALNAAGAGPLSAPLEIVPQPTLPAPPQSLWLDGASVMEDSFRITWTAPADTPGLVTAAYAPCIAETALSGAGPNSTTGAPVCLISARVNSTSLSFVFRFLRPNTAYVASVATVSSAGTTSPFAAPFVGVRTRPLRPAVPPPPQVVAVFPNAALLAMPVYADVSNSVAAFEVTLMPQAPLLPRNVTVTVPRLSVASSFNFTGLVPGGNYSVTAAALAPSTGLRSEPSAAVFFSARAVAPGVADSFSVGEVTTSSFRLSWTAPLSDGGSPVKSYGLLVNSSADGMAAPRFFDLGLAQSFVLTGLQPGAAYFLVLTAVNSVGPGDRLVLPPVLLPRAAPAIVSAVAAAAPGALGSAFGPGSRVVLRLDAAVNVSLLASASAADWLVFTPAVTCPFTGAIVLDSSVPMPYPTSSIVLTFAAAAGGAACVGPDIGSSIVTLLPSARIVAGGAQGPASVSAPSAAVSPPLSGRWGEQTKFLTVLAEVARVDQGATVSLRSLFGLGGNFSALAAEVTVRVTASIGSITPESAGAFTGAARD